MTVTMKIRALRLFVATPSGDVGRTIHFHDGLNILRADNTAGKSTALQGIIYALGLEGMLSASQRIPLPHAMTDTVSINGIAARVINSHVELEISNKQGEIITVRRSVVDEHRNQHLVTVTIGPDITLPNSEYGRHDYFVKHAGAAQNLAGFHRYLAEFLQFELPRVRKVDGNEVPLYLETLFPFFYVEQKHGWSGIQARIPTYFRIREVGKRSAEFILGLDAFDRVLRREQLDSKLAEIETEWQAKGKSLYETAKFAKVIIRNPASRISNGLTEEDCIPVVSVERDWLAIPAALERFRLDLMGLSGREVVTVGEASIRLEQELIVLEAGLQQTLVLATGLADERGDLERQLSQVEMRLIALEEDLQRHKDALLLQGYGSVHLHSLVSEEHVCPTCHQSVDEGADIAAHAMSISDNVNFIERQLSTFNGTRADLARVLDAISVREASLAAQANDYRREIRSCKESLSSANFVPSVADISKRLILEERIQVLTDMNQEIFGIRNDLVTLAQLWSEVKLQLVGLSRDNLSEVDKRKLRSIESSVRSQLEQYGFSSLKPSEIDINQETYRPANDGFDLGFDLSASDMIRVIWAYLFAMLEIGATEGNHLGLLIFDEPRQQETARESYQALLSNASARGIIGSQVIFATSEPEASLLSMLSGSSYSLTNLSVGEKLLLPLI